MTREETKLTDAHAILDELRNPRLQTDRERFRSRTSDFLNTARSVMQYIGKRAEKKKRFDWFKELDDGSEWCCRFRRIRNKDVHERPFQPVGVHDITLHSYELRKKQPGERCTVSFNHRIVAGSRTGLTLDEDGNPVTVLRMGDKANLRLDPGAMTKGISLKSRFVIEMDGKDQPLFESCKAYLAELERNIEKARAQGIIDD